MAPKVSNLLALTALQREGSKLEKALEGVKTDAKTVSGHSTTIGNMKKDIKALKEKVGID